MRRKANKLSRPVGRYYSDIWERHSMIDVISDIALKCLGIIAAAVVIVIGIGALGRNKCECITEQQSVDHEKRTPVTGREILTDPPVYHLPDDGKTHETEKSGSISLIIMDSSGNVIARGSDLNAEKNEDVFSLPADEKDEFTIVLDCTDSRAEDEHMYIIVKGIGLSGDKE